MTTPAPAQAPRLTVGQLLDFEAANPRHTSHKETRIITELGIRPARFYQLLHRAAHTLDAITHDPITARRVRDRAPMEGQPR